MGDRPVPPTHPASTRLQRHPARLPPEKSGRLRYYRAYEEHAKTWRTHIHQACRRLLNHLCQSTCQPELALGELQLWDNPDAG
uniref:Uncharacterized protein n=1 Tax=Conchiformibius kuhniae TaxID=211502 RepID=A0A8T9MWM9_9NEIS|nr:hypothetical protein LVJ77_10175 [Conchiformibius kuhniae]